jgi:hypothetical protein
MLPLIYLEALHRFESMVPGYINSSALSTTSINKIVILKHNPCKEVKGILPGKMKQHLHKRDCEL